MVKKVHNITGIAVTADGTVIPQSEWFAKPQEFDYSKNKALIDEYARQSDPNYRAKERAKRRFERVEARRKELEALQQTVQNELNELETR